jgi:glycerophosphoryl diester phosphodiesterase
MAGPPLVVAHRGAPRDGAVENTLRAFERAAREGRDGVELDLRLTADERAVVIHDATTFLDGGIRARVRALPYSALRGTTGSGADRVPLLEEVLEALGGRCGLVVEVKDPDAVPVAARILGGLRPAARPPWRILASFRPEAVRGFALLLPRERRALVVSPRGPGVAGALRGLAPVAAARRCGAHDLLLRHDLVSARRVAAMDHTGGRVLAWTVNAPDAVRRVAAAGAAGIITDDPAMATETLVSGGS